MRPNHTLFRFMLISLFVLSCKNMGNKPERLPPESDTPVAESELISVSRDQFAMAAMVLGGLKLYPFDDLVNANGYLDVPPEKRVKIGTFMGGHIKSAELIPGDHVEKGQVLLILENSEYLKLQQSFLETKEQLAYLKSVYESQKTLAEEKISAQRNFLQAKSDYGKTLAAYESLARQLKLLQIDPAAVNAESMTSSIKLVSPIDGYITEFNAINGIFVNPSDVLCEIVDPSHLHVELKVFEKDLFKLRKGQVISFRIPDASRESYSGEIILIGKTVEGSERTILVHGHITGKPVLNLLPGMYIEALIHTESKQLEGLPTDALATEEGKNFVFVKRSEQKDAYVFEKVPVKVGIIRNDWFEVIDSSGILRKAADNILIRGVYYLTQEQ